MKDAVTRYQTGLAQRVQKTAIGDWSYLPVDVGTDTANVGVTVTGPGPICGRKLDHVTLVATAVPGFGVEVQ